MKKKILSFGIPAMVCFALAAVLLAGGMVGSARAALNVYSERYLSDINLLSIGVTLNEKTGDETDAQPVSYRNYIEKDGSYGWDMKELSLLSWFSREGAEALVVGKKYTEELTVTNSGSIPIYVRAYVYRYWTSETDDGELEKDQSLDPTLIGLEFGTGWVKDEGATTKEREVWYYKAPLEAEAASTPLVEKIWISTDVKSAVDDTAQGEYLYDEKYFNLEVEVDAIQAENADEAAMSAWSRALTAESDSGEEAADTLKLE